MYLNRAYWGKQDVAKSLLSFVGYFHLAILPAAYIMLTKEILAKSAEITGLEVTVAVLELTVTVCLMAGMFAGLCLAPLIASSVIKSNIGSANFYSGFFENDLDGHINLDDLAAVTGKSRDAVRRQIISFQNKYLINCGYDKNADEIVLGSKKVKCQCRNCGAVIEKSQYFVGTCPYCGGSDIFADVLTEGGFYRLQTEQGEKSSSSDFYLKQPFGLKTASSMIGAAACLVAAAFNLFVFFFADVIVDEEDYYPEINMAFLIFAVFFAALIFKNLYNLYRFSAAKRCAKYFSQKETYMCEFDELPAGRGFLKKLFRMSVFDHCAFGAADGKVKIALARRIVRDCCPNCGGAITGEVNEGYVCKFCGQPVWGVTVKK